MMGLVCKPGALAALTVAALVALATLDASAATLSPYKNLKVTDNGNQTFTVEGVPKLGHFSFWCAAGSYSLDHLNVSATTKLYVVDPKSSGRDNRVVFSTSPVEPAVPNSTSLSARLRTPGASISAAKAERQCYEIRDYFND